MERLRFFSVFIIGFVIYFYFDAVFFSFLQKQITKLTQSKAVGHIFAYVITLVPLVITIAILNKGYRNLTEKLGFSKSISVGIIFSFLSTLPMLIAYAMKFSLNRALSIDTIIINTISSAFLKKLSTGHFFLVCYTGLPVWGFYPLFFWVHYCLE